MARTSFIETGITIDELDTPDFILNSGISDTAGFDYARKHYNSDVESFSFLERYYPKNIMLDLTVSMQHITECLPEGHLVDWVALAAKACRCYGAMCDGFDIEDAIFDDYDKDDFKQSMGCGNLTLIGGFSTIAANECYQSHLDAILEAAWGIYKEAAVAFVGDVIFKLQSYNCPSFVSGCAYRPDGFISGTSTLVLVLNFDEA